MRNFWDERAREDAYFFIDNNRSYRDVDLTEFWSEGERTVDQLLAVLGVTFRPSDVALDIGCGVGRLTRAIAKRARLVYGIDVSREMIERAREHNLEVDNVEWLVGDGTSLRPIPDGGVDACLSHVVFQHIPDPRITLGYVAEMARVLRPGGWAGFQISNDPSIHAKPAGGGVGARLKARLGRSPAGQCDPAWLGSAVDLDDLRDVAQRSGLTLERIVGEGTQFCLVLVRRSAS
jgi:SAM-dependent methyltransferase